MLLSLNRLLSAAVYAGAYLLRQLHSKDEYHGLEWNPQALSKSEVNVLQTTIDLLNVPTSYSPWKL